MKTPFIIKLHAAVLSMMISLGVKLRPRLIVHGSNQSKQQSETTKGHRHIRRQDMHA